MVDAADVATVIQSILTCAPGAPARAWYSP